MGSRSVLVVEDDRITAMDLRNSLGHLGYRVLAVVPSGEEAVALSDGPADKPDAVLMDIRLDGGMNGIEAAAAIRRRRDIPIIFLSVVTDMDMLRQALAVEPAGYLVKPFEHAELGIALEIALCRYDSERTARRERARLQAVLDHAPCAVFVLRDGVCLLANTACRRLCGCDPVQLPAPGLLGLIHADYRAALLDLLALSASPDPKPESPEEHRDPRQWRKTLLLVDGHGRETWCDLSAASILFEGRPALVCSAMDLPGRG